MPHDPSDDDICSHRTRTNRRASPPEPKLHPPAALIAAIDEVFEPLEDKD